ncbi:MAG TPA: XdhC family protein [Spirochaetales bacterium]|nr:XdhC family protein [Spirochaetales bacterium]HRY55862.1 XdhC family protein [Spirochaetia bacterium]HRZ65411.1 XdhC family protein [Spirochaetia bacterium]
MDKRIIAGAANEAGRVALVTILEVRGSAPRHPGSKMLVRPSGEIEGSIGGGLGESRAIEASLAAISGRRSSLLEVEMLGAEAEGPDSICGGVNRMLVEFVADPAPYAAALAALESGERAVFEKRITRGEGGRLEARVSLLPEGEGLPEEAARALAGRKLRLAEGEGLAYDPIFPEEKLLVVGAGHVGRALALAAQPLGFQVSVIDDRAELLGEDRLGKGVRRICGGYEEAIAAFPFDKATYAAVLTRGHLYDLESIRAVLKRKYRYAGLIGSRRKVALLLEQLRKDGYPEAAIANLHTPIGLDIGSETPEEIAISILAEMIALRHDRQVPRR